MQERVALELLLLLEEINNAGPHILLLGHKFWDVFDSLAVADNHAGILRVLDGVWVDCLFNAFAVADKRLGIVVLLVANCLCINGSGLIETREWVGAVVVHAGLGGSDGHVGGRHFYFTIACENHVFMVKCPDDKCPGKMTIVLLRF